MHRVGYVRYPIRNAPKRTERKVPRPSGSTRPDPVVSISRSERLLLTEAADGMLLSEPAGRRPRICRANPYNGACLNVRESAWRSEPGKPEQYEDEHVVQMIERFGTSAEFSGVQRSERCAEHRHDGTGLLPLWRVQRSSPVRRYPHRRIKVLALAVLWP